MQRLIPLLFVALLWGVFSVPAIREFHFFSLLPYGSFWFFVSYVAVALVVFLTRHWLSRLMSYSLFLFVVNLLFYVLLFPNPVHVLVFAAYFYAIYYLYHLHSAKIPQWQALLFTLLPMIVARSTREIQFVGLSYVTFRAFHVIMDAPYMERPSWRDYFSFLMFFPSLLAGPIDRWQKFGPQLKTGFAEMSVEKMAAGYRLLLLGAAMKFVLAELVSRQVLEAHLARPLGYFAEFYGYPTYLYLDFAGYSAMALGCALLVGLKLPANFDQPYLSRNPQDFWRRFHITLGTWLNDYFFKPIYKALHGLPALQTRPLMKQNVAIFSTFFLMGCWNGLKAHYLISGALFGFYSVVFNSYVYWCKRRGGAPQLMGSAGLTRAVAVFLTVNACCLALYIFGGRSELFQ